jgi:fumarate reductase flavoprotein subunit
MPDLVVAGAGMAGLASAARARELGATVELLEKGSRAGGSMLLSSGVVWRHRDLDDFRAHCPDGDPELQRTVFERLDGDLAWLESLGAEVVGRETGNALTSGVRFDTESLTAALTAAAGGRVRLGEPLRELPAGVPVVLATGGFQADLGLLREYVTAEAEHVRLRAAPWSSGDGLRIGLAAGGERSAGMEQVYGRNMPAPPARVDEQDFVPAAQLYARHARVTNERGERYEPRTWSEIDVVQWTARQPRARAWFRVDAAALGERVRDRTVDEMVAAAEAAGAPVERDTGAVTVETVAGITSTLGGLRIDGRARVADGVFAAGGDVGGIATGGYASGLAAALVFGKIAAESALGVDQG